MRPQSDLNAVEIELTIYKLVLFGVVLPIFGMVAPVFLIHQAVVDAYRFARRIAALLGIELEPVEQINFEGHAFLIAAAGIALVAIIAFSVQFGQTLKRAASTRMLPDAPGARRFRDIPAQLKVGLEHQVTRLWLDIAADRPPPRLVCFASTGLSACVSETDGLAAIALSTGLIDHMSKREDSLPKVILLHEMAHLVGGDLRSFRALAAFVSAYRRTFLILLSAITAVYLVTMFAEYFNLSGIDQRSPSFPAYLTRTARDVIFSYASLILVLRYTALIIMLTELRADLRAAITLGSLAAFASTVRGASGVKPSSRTHLFQSLVGTKVAHLTAGERLSLLELPHRLFTPKYRYFAASIALGIFLIVDGSLAFSGFDWVLQVGIIATVAGLNAITIAMFLAINMAVPGGVGFSRRLAIATIVVGANLLFLFSPSAVMGTMDTIIVAISDPNFTYAGSAFNQALSEWYTASAKPAIDTLLDGRAELWVTVIFCTLWLSGRVPDFARRGFVSVAAGFVAAFATVIVAAGAPFATYLLLPGNLWQSRDQIGAFMVAYGAPIPVMAGAIVGITICVFARRHGHPSSDLVPLP